MQDLHDLEIFEINVLELLNSIKVLDSLYFGGGTMLRLCHNLNRYSTDLDFWLDSNVDPKIMFKKLRTVLSEKYSIIDEANKRNTILFQFRSSKSKRSLKIEIRKGQTDFEWERKIAFSKLTSTQVMVKGLTLEQMMQNKIKVFLSRKIIRDCFDIQFLVMRGIKIKTDIKVLQTILELIQNFKTRDFKVTLGSLLNAKDREFYLENKFKLLEEEIKSQMNTINYSRKS